MPAMVVATLTPAPLRLFLHRSGLPMRALFWQPSARRLHEVVVCGLNAEAEAEAEVLEISKRRKPIEAVMDILLP